MSKETILNNLNTSIRLEVLPNEAKEDPVAFVNTLIYNKHDKNSDILRSEILTSFATNNQELKTSLSQYSDLITRTQFTNDTILQETKQSSDRSKTRRLSVDFDGKDDDADEDLNELPNNDEDEDANVSQLRKRLLQGGRSQDDHHQGQKTTFDEKLHMEELRQEDILKDMFQFVRSIKEGADAFNAKLSQDQNVLKAAEAGLDPL
ncbi:hypothetical protein WICANDRAFT_62559 [Wickerhamomyces anomalus NRRL Y-366-8]|uniref:Uncharacterized protein n=1 Tax=Wickerhamomyces anomalus (strain ATCC 58044 / CBS 1984 / NCYC 433 / NRRL Y-366-8) TaxID=683960 RepID=A0A1E3P457_WICAA|nr:uncharacterized protein WICANDRAFT_62559 [Wickerhamomyces anomalus NRRL Y-366-8]ODQ59984.1 hypothetical protein WICANDRAFT_62559 [Wickerhamomyces anomalus NRRL Y-366-8]